eukprot:Selendium_serpulae@DN5155_c0_g1_i1.p1
MKPLIRLKHISEMAQTLKASRLEITRKHLKAAIPAKETLAFGRSFSDHMLEVDWEQETGWNAPAITPLRRLSLHPATSALHYGLQVFEGMKAFRSEKDKSKTLLFRPEMNCERMRKGCERVALPGFDEKELLKLIQQLVLEDERWIPQGLGYSLYIRPTCISTEECLGIVPPSRAKLYIILSPVGPYFASGFKPIQLLADTQYTRAF